MPVLLTMIAEKRVASFPLTFQFWTAGTSSGYYCITTIWSRAPSGIRIHG
uniref:Uncharacterized protein n=1 Tax=Arion vulgaris TaxID=1028688 RepID=A0A0B6ZMF1_9EUPU